MIRSKWPQKQKADRPNGCQTQLPADSLADIVAGYMRINSAQHMGRCAGCGKMGHYKKVCRSKRDHAVHGLEVEMAQYPQDEDIVTVSMYSVYMN